MIDFQQIFHIGVRVADLDTAMRELGDSLGLTWAEARDNPAQTLWTPEHGLQHLHGRANSGAHHVGVWVDSVTDETDRLVAAGWTLVGARADPAEGNGYGVFSYVQPPSGLIVELVDRAVLPYFESWWSTAT
jgi:catechol 2,3-dioxygenase-like lactoylglutathione lyase family enzyme